MPNDDAEWLDWPADECPPLNPDTAAVFRIIAADARRRAGQLPGIWFDKRLPTLQTAVAGIRVH